MLLNVCVKCHKSMKPKENGIYVFEYADFGLHSVWFADLWICSKCGTEVITGFGAQPIYEHWEAAFEGFVKRIRKNGNTAAKIYEVRE